MSRIISTRRNRNYSTQFTWSYELNVDLYNNCYKKAREDPSIGYMNRMKNLWDILHPEHSHFTTKQLRQQASNIEKKQLIFKNMQTPSNSQNTTSSVNNSNDGDIIHNEENLTTETTTPPEMLEENNELIEQLQTDYLTTFEKVYKMEIHDRPYHIKATDLKPLTNEMKSVNYIAHQHLCNLKSDRNIELWDINVAVYSAAVTVLQSFNKLKEHKDTTAKQVSTPKWIQNIDSKINSIRRKIAHLRLIIKCKQNGTFTPHQERIHTQLKQKYGSTSFSMLHYKLKLNEQELKATVERLRYQKRLHERKTINRKFKSNPKAVYREFKESAIKVTNTPSTEDVNKFWKGIWCNDKQYNGDSSWVKYLEKEYCKSTKQSVYNITNEILDKALTNMQNNKAPGPDRIVAFWYKHFDFYRSDLITLLQQTFKAGNELPPWLCKAQTLLLPKNKDTQLAKNYRPIACLNIMYKLYTSCINMFIQDHCETNNIITMEQAGGKAKVWGCTEHLLINKMVSDEVISNRRNLCTMWLDYQKAFDSVPHSWLIKALELANIPTEIIHAVKSLTNNWATILRIHSITGTIESDLIKFVRGIFQGDTLSVILFILSVNPLSFILKQCKGYYVGSSANRSVNLTHLFFVDDLKLYTTTMDNLKAMLDIITQFSNDIGMTFGESKCAYQIIERGKLQSSTENIIMNGVTIRPLDEGECYKYLGQDENISLVGPINKEKVMKEYIHRVKKIWSSELSGYNKFIAHNAFAVPVLTPTFAILKWTLAEIDNIDVKTRKMLNITNNFHRNSDIDQLYLPRNAGGRGLCRIRTTFESRNISVANHLIANRNRNPYLEKVKQHENNTLIRYANELLNSVNITEDDYTTTPSKLAKKYREQVYEEHKNKYLSKVTHGYITKTIANDPLIDHSASVAWCKDKTLTSHFESYVLAIKQQEIYTKDLLHRRGNSNEINNRCRLCKSKVEDITHVISSCPKMSARYYLPLRHDIVAKATFNAIRKLHNPEKNSNSSSYPHETIINEGDYEYWWNVSIKTSCKVPHNRPDLVVWNLKEKTCNIIEFSCPADVNVSAKVTEKENIYAHLIRNLQLMYHEYKFIFTPVIIGALGTVTKCLHEHLIKYGFSQKHTNNLIRKLQVLSISGTVKICKTFMKFSM